MALIPIPPEFLCEPKALRHAGASARGGWAQIVLAFWCHDHPWPDFTNKYETMSLSGIQAPAWERQYPVIVKCWEEYGERITKEHARQTSKRQVKRDIMLQARAIGIIKQSSGKRLQDTTSANNSFTAAGATRATSAPRAGQSNPQAIDIAIRSHAQPGMMSEAITVQNELENTLTDE